MTSGVTCNLKGPRNSPIQNAATRVVFTLAPCRWYQVVRISETSMQFYGYLFASSFHGSNSKGPKVCPLDMCFSWIFVFANSRWTQFSKKSQKKIRTSRPQSPVPSHHKRVWLHRYLATKPPCFPAVLQPSTSSTCFSWAYPTLGAVEFKFQAGPPRGPSQAHVETWQTLSKLLASTAGPRRVSLGCQEAGQQWTGAKKALRTAHEIQVDDSMTEKEVPPATLDWTCWLRRPQLHRNESRGFCCVKMPDCLSWRVCFT